MTLGSPRQRHKRKWQTTAHAPLRCQTEGSRRDRWPLLQMGGSDADEDEGGKGRASPRAE